MPDNLTELKIQRLSVMSEPMRLRILKLIANAGELRAIDILPEFGITQPTLSHHLNQLTEYEIITARKDGRCTYYSINKGTVDELSSFVLSLSEPPIVKTVRTRKPSVSVSSAKKVPSASPALKKTTSVPEPKALIVSPDLEEIKKSKKNKKKDKDKKKNKDKEKDKKKKKK